MVDPTPDEQAQRDALCDYLTRYATGLHLVVAGLHVLAKKLRDGEIDCRTAYERLNGALNALRWARTDPPAQRGAE